jgi:hypothetical protein
MINGSTKYWGGVVYTAIGLDEPSTFIEYLAVQESSHDWNDEFHPVLSPDFYDFSAGAESTFWTEKGIKNEFVGVEKPGLNLLGGRRVGVFLLCLVQCLPITAAPTGEVEDQEMLPDNPPNGNGENASLEKTGLSTLYLQALISTFAYRRYCSLGFTYSALHFATPQEGSNASWPLCSDPITELPKGLGSAVISYCAGEGCDSIRLLRTVGPPIHSYPLLLILGCPVKCRILMLLSLLKFGNRVACFQTPMYSCPAITLPPKPRPNPHFIS